MATSVSFSNTDQLVELSWAFQSKRDIWFSEELGQVPHLTPLIGQIGQLETQLKDKEVTEANKTALEGKLTQANSKLTEMINKTKRILTTFLSAAKTQKPKLYSKLEAKKGFQYQLNTYEALENAMFDKSIMST